MVQTAQRSCSTCGFKNDVAVRDLVEGAFCRGCRGRLRPLATPLPVDGRGLEVIALGTRLPVLVEVQLRGSREEREQREALEKAAAALEGKAFVVKLDAHEERDLAFRLGVVAVPTFLIFLGGQIAYSFEGFADAALMEEWIWQLTRG